jgi:hypothetical protein
MYFVEMPYMPKFLVNIEKHDPMAIPISWAISHIATVKLNAPRPDSTDFLIS